MSSQKEQSAFQQFMQKFGRFLSGMVMPNIGAFIAWGFITALFIPTGWMPNEYFAQLVGPMVKWLIPLLLGFTGGYAVYQHRGGVVGAIATSGVIAGSEIPMFLGAMIMGPLGGYIIKKFDGMIEDSIPGGFEMLVNNFSAGIIGGGLTMLAFSVVGPVVLSLNDVLRGGVEGIVAMGILPITSVIIEPAKILFLNNAINHGVLSPLGIQQAEEFGKSMFFLLEANPGPGFGVLLAYALFGKGMVKGSAPGAIIIHVLGGIHEIYFPYILMKPALILAVIGGGAAGVFTMSILDGGLIAPASPGSIIAVLAMTPKGCFLANMADFLVATAVSFAIASVIIKASKDEEGNLEAATESMKNMKAQSKGAVIPNGQSEIQVAGKDLKFIVYACDAGMGSSALGAAALRKKLRKAGYADIKVQNFAIGNIPKDAQLVVSHEKLAQRAIDDSPQAEHIFVQNFTENNVYEIVMDRLKGVTGSVGQAKIEEEENHVADGVLLKENIKINLKSVSKEEAIKAAGELLVKSGYVGQNYVQGMLNREKTISTYVGKGISIPHGENAVKDSVKKSGIVVLQYPQGIDWGDGNMSHLVVGIAGKNDDHLAILANIAGTMDEYDDAQLNKLYKTTNKDDLYKVFVQ